ncbi:uncharacterized protein LOC129739453 [Uranotaenia lowii]|uniref:uncharacterized protein LOC129739453 n=1 Tax=Uranotaenia lowii TaxID=190385 RepID=UPI00247A13C9|nr:uncharacterized protein LOC129739453 [Uranotaenia lowii]
MSGINEEIPPDHDSGAVGAAKGFSSKKPSKKKLRKALQKSMEENNSLREQLERLSSDQQIDQNSEQNSDAGLRPTHSSTMREDGSANVSTRNESVLLATMNSVTLGSLSIPECIPKPGKSEIDKESFKYWKDMVTAAFKMANSADEQTKWGVFQMKCGMKLYELLKSCPSEPGMPDGLLSPFSNAMARLDRYFGSRTYLLAERGKLINIYQSANENSIEFVRRVSSAAKLCDYTEDEEMEAVVRQLMKGASDSCVRKLAHRNWVRQGSMKDLIDLVRDRELEKANEEEYQRLRGRNEQTSSVAMIAHGTVPRQQSWRGRGMPRGNRGFRRGGRGFYQTSTRDQRTSCWRCGRFGHHSSSCGAADKDCRNCGRWGHIARACSSSAEDSKTKTWKRPASSEDQIIPKKIAAIESKSEQDSDNEVHIPDKDPE